MEGVAGLPPVSRIIIRFGERNHSEFQKLTLQLTAKSSASPRMLPSAECKLVNVTVHPTPCNCAAARSESLSTLASNGHTSAPNATQKNVMVKTSAPNAIHKRIEVLRFWHKSSGKNMVAVTTVETQPSANLCLQKHGQADAADTRQILQALAPPQRYSKKCDGHNKGKTAISEPSFAESQRHPPPCTTIYATCAIGLQTQVLRELSRSSTCASLEGFLSQPSCTSASDTSFDGAPNVLLICSLLLGQFGG